MSPAARPVYGAVVVLLMLAGIGAGSRVPVTLVPTDSALVRLAWRTIGERVRHCRTLTPEELQKIPSHMRRTEECRDVALPYRLTVEIGERQVGDRLVHAAGARQDRPLYVFQEFPIAPGEHHLTIHYARAAEPPAGAEAVGETPPQLELDTVVHIAAREIVVVTYDADRRRLVLEPRGP
jgi:hypothetical protein